MSAAPIVGGMFGPDCTSGRKESLAAILPPHRHCEYFAAARCGLRAAATTPDIRRIWLPSYLCASMIDGLSGVDREIRFYAVTDALGVSDFRWTRELEDRDLVVIVAYFGVDPTAELCATIRQTGAHILLDATGSPPTYGGDVDADAILLSPRKIAGVPDGGILLDVTGRLAPLPQSREAPKDWSKLADEAFLLRADFDQAGAYGADRRWQMLRDKWETGFPHDIWSMRATTRLLLESGLPWSTIAERRRKNHAALANRLAPLGFPSLADNSTSPVGYVLKLDSEARRKGLRDALIAGAIYPPIHWVLPSAVPRRFAVSYALSARTLTLPCDQRYGTPEMERIAELVIGVIGGQQ